MARAGVKPIVYLGGLQPAGHGSAQFASWGEIGTILRHRGMPVSDVRAGVVIAPGSVAFEVIRDWVFHLPTMATRNQSRRLSQFLLGKPPAMPED